MAKAVLLYHDKAGLPDPDGAGPLPRASFVIKVPTNKERIADAQTTKQLIDKKDGEVSGTTSFFGQIKILCSLHPCQFSQASDHVPHKL